MIIEEIGKMCFEDAARLFCNICVLHECGECPFDDICTKYMFEFTKETVAEFDSDDTVDVKYELKPNNMFCKNCKEPNCDKNGSTCAMVREYLHYRSLK